MTQRTIQIEVHEMTYGAALKMVDGVLTGLDMNRTNQFKILGAMERLSEAVRIAEQHDKEAT